MFLLISAIWLTACCIFALWYVNLDFADTVRKDVCFLSGRIGYPLETSQTYIPVSVIIVVNWRILLVSRKQPKTILAQTFPAPDNNTDNKDQLGRKIHMKIAVRFFVALKATKTFSIVVAVLTFCILVPSLVGTILDHFCSKMCERYFLVIFRYELYGINSVVNVYINGMRYVKYRKAFGKLLLKVTSHF